MTDTGDMIGTAVGLGVGLIALNAVSNMGRNMSDEEIRRKQRERRRLELERLRQYEDEKFKRREWENNHQRDFWEETFG